MQVGCGLGLASIVAARRGARVVASDGNDDVLALLAQNCETNAVEDQASAELARNVLDGANATATADSEGDLVANNITLSNLDPNGIAAFLVDEMRDGYISAPTATEADLGCCGYLQTRPDCANVNESSSSE